MSLIESLEGLWKRAYKEGRFELLDQILYHRTKHSIVLTIDSKEHIKLILHEFHDMSIAGHLSTDRTLERVKITAWWPDWKKDVEVYCETCITCQKSNRAKGKGYGLLQEIG